MVLGLGYIGFIVDNYGTLYQGGNSIPYSNTYWYAMQQVMSSNACLLAIHGTNTGGPAGILASTTTGTITDSSWKCSSVSETNWTDDNFDDSHWSYAVAQGQNEHYGGLLLVTGVDPNAQWIWVSPYSNNAFCRKYIC